MLLRRWGRTLAKHGIALTENEEAPGRLELFLDMWESVRRENHLNKNPQQAGGEQ